ncbi:tautomerase family protein [Labilithrix luteola]|nr:tautomerase family protein [Labilithrix luteola]
MPLVRISLGIPKSPEVIQAISDGIHRALVDAFGIPEDDRFQVVCPNESLVYDRGYLGIERSEDVIFVQVTLVRGRAVEKKRTFYRLVVENLSRSPGLRKQDIVISLVENDRADWSVGNGEAQLLI